MNVVLNDFIVFIADDDNNSFPQIIIFDAFNDKL